MSARKKRDLKKGDRVAMTVGRGQVYGKIIEFVDPARQRVSIEKDDGSVTERMVDSLTLAGG